MSDMFEYLEAQAVEENLPFKNAAVVAIDRSERRFASFVSSAQGEKEFNARLELIRSEVEKIAVAACEEYGYNDPEHIAKLALGQIEILGAATPEPEGRADSKQKLDKQNPEGYYTKPSPKLNPGSAGDNMKNTNPEIPELTPDDKQDPTDKEWPWDAPLPEANLVDVRKQKPEQVGPSTQTFGEGNQADPVTASVFEGDPDDDAEMGKFLDEEYADMPDAESNPEGWKKWVEENTVSSDEAFGHMASAERMDFNSLSEIMTPSEAIGHLVEAGMPDHEAKDRIDFYVNHVNPGWAAKNWTSAVEKESLWDTNDPELVDMSHNVGVPSVEDIRLVYEQYANSGRFETAQELIDALFMMYAENADPSHIDHIAQMFDEAIGRGPSNVEQVKQHAMRFAGTKVADHPGVMMDQIQMIRGALERNVSSDGEPLSEMQRRELENELSILENSYENANKEYYEPGMNIDQNEEDRLRAESLDEEPLDDESALSTRTTPTRDIPVKYKMTKNIYESFLKKQNKK